MIRSCVFYKKRRIKVKEQVKLKPKNKHKINMFNNQINIYKTKIFKKKIIIIHINWIKLNQRTTINTRLIAIMEAQGKMKSAIITYFIFKTINNIKNTI